mgnify:CR=1 FL=1
MRIAVSDLLFPGFQKFAMRALKPEYGIEYFYEFGKNYYTWLQEQAANGDKDAQWRLDKMDKNGVNLLDSEFSSADLDAIMHYGRNATRTGFFIFKKHSSL